MPITFIIITILTASMHKLKFPQMKKKKKLLENRFNTNLQNERAVHFYLIRFENLLVKCFFLFCLEVKMRRTKNNNKFKKIKGMKHWIGGVADTKQNRMKNFQNEFRFYSNIVSQTSFAFYVHNFIIFFIKQKNTQ